MKASSHGYDGDDGRGEEGVAKCVNLADCSNMAFM